MEIEGKGTVESYSLVDSPACRDGYRGFEKVLVLFEKGKLLGTGDKGSIQWKLPDGGFAPNAR